ncbi:MAG TPA: CDGSH iron-sulfur domain-containing protein [Gemmatimonadaceae bacterium]|nr:CDGSH iron-sulfur domain-containing protein [Gemmatimonadaceae bacterium]
MPDEPSIPRRSPITIRVKQNGPYLIELADVPHVRIVDTAGRELTPEPGRSIALCRCGGSATKPFCDKSHRQIGFCDPTPAREPGWVGGAGGTEPARDGA